MSSFVHYKFKGALSYDHVAFAGSAISNRDLKNLIIEQKRLGRSLEFDLLLTNAHTREAYRQEHAMVAKDSSIVVTRVPISSKAVHVAKQKAWQDFRRKTSKDFDRWTENAASAATATAAAAASRSEKPPMSFDELTNTSDLVTANATEDDKIKAMMKQSTKDYDPSTYMKKNKPVPKHYLCHICNSSGHFIDNCPRKNEINDGERYKRKRRACGIPRTFLTPVDNPNVPGAMLTAQGTYAVQTMHAHAYIKGKQEKPPFVPMSAEEEAAAIASKGDKLNKRIPDELLCPVCKDFLTYAVVIPCCGNSGCDECIRTGMIESENNACPVCKEPNQSPDNLVANKILRAAVRNYNPKAYSVPNINPAQLQLQSPPSRPQYCKRRCTPSRSTVPCSKRRRYNPPPRLPSQNIKILSPTPAASNETAPLPPQAAPQTSSSQAAAANSLPAFSVHPLGMHAPALGMMQIYNTADANNMHPSMPDLPSPGLLPHLSMPSSATAMPVPVGPNAVTSQYATANAWTNYEATPTDMPHHLPPMMPQF